MKKYGFLVTLAILWVAILVAPVAANQVEAGVVPDDSVSRHQVSSSSDGYVPAAPSVRMSNEAKATVYVYQQAPPAPRYNRPRRTAPKPCVKKAYHAPHRHTNNAPKKARVALKPTGKPILTNKAGGSAFGSGILNSTIAVTSNGVVVKIMKGIMSGKPGSEWLWATPGHTLNINRPSGSLLRFIIAVRNTDSSDLPTDRIFVHDDLAFKLSSRPESGALFMGATKIRNLSADELTKLTSGVKISVKQYNIDTIPAKRTLGIRYDVRIVGGGSGSKDPQNMASTNDDPGSTGKADPSWWLKISSWIIGILLGVIFLLLLRWLLGMIRRSKRTRSKPYDSSPSPAPTPAEDEPALTMEQMEEAARRGTI